MYPDWQLWLALDKPPIHRKYWINFTLREFKVQYLIRELWSCVLLLTFITTEHRGLPFVTILVRILSGYCSSAYLTGRPTCSEFTHIISNACDRNQVVYCSHSKAHNLAQESPIEKIKVPFWSAINVFSDVVLISVSTKCGEWVGFFLEYCGACTCM